MTDDCTRTEASIQDLAPNLGEVLSRIIQELAILESVGMSACREVGVH